MKITVINTNGNPRVHRAYCRDINAEASSAKGQYRGESFVLGEFNSKEEIFLDYNADFIAENNGDLSAGWEMDYAPCVDLPETVKVVKAPAKKAPIKVVPVAPVVVSYPCEWGRNCDNRAFGEVPFFGYEPKAICDDCLSKLSTKADYVKFAV